MSLNNIKPSIGSKNKKKRTGRGVGSGIGKTCGRGHKGQNSRSGNKCRIGFEGGQTPIYRRLPKRGFSSPYKNKKNIGIQLYKINQLHYTDINIHNLKKTKLVPKNTNKVKIFFSGTYNKHDVIIRDIHTTNNVRNIIKTHNGKIIESDVMCSTIK